MKKGKQAWIKEMKEAQANPKESLAAVSQCWEYGFQPFSM
jgi:hypothetical protein